MFLFLFLFLFLFAFCFVCFVLFCLSCCLSNSEYVSLSELSDCEQVFWRLGKPMVSTVVKFDRQMCLNV